MENNTTKSRGSLKALFLIPSIIGVILFMIPVKNADGDWTVSYTHLTLPTIA